MWRFIWGALWEAIILLLLLGYYTNGKRNFGKSHPQVIIHRHITTSQTFQYLHFLRLPVFPCFIFTFSPASCIPLLHFCSFPYSQNSPFFPFFRFLPSHFLFSRLIPALINLLLFLSFVTVLALISILLWLIFALLPAYPVFPCSLFLLLSVASSVLVFVPSYVCLTYCFLVLDKFWLINLLVFCYR